MKPEQENHMIENSMEFQKEYIEKYTKGQKEHGGDMWQMGLKQVLNEAKQEVLDQWSYVRQIEKCVEELEEKLTDKYYNETELRIILLQIINRVKAD